MAMSSLPPTGAQISCDIFIRTYPGDYPWLKYCISAITKFAKGFRKLWVISPEECPWPYTVLPNQLEFEWKQMNDETEDGYLAQQITKLYADVITDYQADYILHIDSDVILTREVRPENFLTNDGRVIWPYTPYTSIETPWQPIVEKFIDGEMDIEFMRRFPIMIPRWLYPRLREFCHRKHGMVITDYVRNQPHRAFSEFNALGAYAWKFHHDRIFWIDTLEWHGMGPPTFARQFHSWGGITPEVKAEIETILSGGDEASATHERECTSPSAQTLPSILLSEERKRNEQRQKIEKLLENVPPYSDEDLSGGVESRHIAEGSGVSNKRGVSGNTEMLSASYTTDKDSHCVQRSSHGSGGPVRSRPATHSEGSVSPAQTPFSGSAFSSKDDGDKRRMAATAEEGTAPNTVQVNAEASVGRSNSGNVKYDANLLRSTERGSEVASSPQVLVSSPQSSVLPKIKKLWLNGSEIWVLEGDQISEWVEQEGRLDHDQNLLPRILEHIKEGDVVVDAGAFIGDHTIAYSMAVGERGIVHAFEPNPEAFKCLGHNTGLLSREVGEPINVKIYNWALSDKSGKVPLSGNNGNWGGAYVGEHMKISDVGTHALETVIPWRVDFIKIDVEGYELKVLRGAGNLIRRCKPRMVIEINEVALGRQNTSPGEIFAWLERHGYSWTVMQENCTIFSPLYDILALPSESGEQGVSSKKEEGGVPSDLEKTLGASISLSDCVKTIQQHAESGREGRRYIMKMLKKAGLFPKR